ATPASTGRSRPRNCDRACALPAGIRHGRDRRADPTATVGRGRCGVVTQESAAMWMLFQSSGMDPVPDLGPKLNRAERHARRRGVRTQKRDRSGLRVAVAGLVVVLELWALGCWALVQWPVRPGVR